MDLRTALKKYGDLLLAAVLALGITLELLSWAEEDVPASIAAGLLATLPFALRRRNPLVVFVLVMVGIELVGRFQPGFDNDSMAFVTSYVLALYSLGRYAVGVEQWLGVAALVAVMVSFVLSEADASAVDTGDVGFVLLFAGAPWGAGVVIRLRLERERLLRERNAALQRDQEARARAAVAAERARIARELHDVVAHAISVTVMQARGGRAMLGRDEDEVRRALDAIEQTNTAALSDMRRLLAVLRDTEDQPDGRAAPQPSLANLDQLVDQVRAAGLSVELAVTGSSLQQELPVPPGVDLSGYRIVQEALTNVLKHAGPVPTTVRVRADGGVLRLDVTSPLPGQVPEQRPGGRGLLGMSERVALHGGSVVCGPEDGLWAVHAELPAPAP